MELEAFYRHFAVPETAVTITSYGNGHINDTYLVRTTERPLYILQRVNRHVFPHPEQVMDNIIGVTEFLSRKLTEAGKDAKRVNAATGALSEWRKILSHGRRRRVAAVRLRHTRSFFG